MGYTSEGGLLAAALASDSADFPARSTLWAENLIDLRALNKSGQTDTRNFITLVRFDERFSLQRVPEPGTLALLGIALAAGAMARRGGRQRPAART